MDVRRPRSDRIKTHDGRVDTPGSTNASTTTSHRGGRACSGIRKRRNIPGVMRRCCAGTKTHLLRALAVPAPLIPVLHAVTFAVLVAVGVARLDMALPCLDVGRVGGRRRRPGVPVRVREFGRVLALFDPGGLGAVGDAVRLRRRLRGSHRLPDERFGVGGDLVPSLRQSFVGLSRSVGARVLCLRTEPRNTFLQKRRYFGGRFCSGIFCSHAIGAAGRRGWWASQTSDSSVSRPMKRPGRISHVEIS